MEILFIGFLHPIGSLCVRLIQITFSCVSLTYSVNGDEYYRYAVFCFLVIIMILVINWNFTLAMIEGYTLLVRSPIPQSDKSLIIAMGDWVVSILMLAAACSSYSVAYVLSDSPASYCSSKCWRRYPISTAMAFLIWFLSMTSSLLNLWLLPSF